MVIALRYFLLYITAALFLASCATMRSIPIETLQPAKLSFDEGLPKNIVIIASKDLLSESVITNTDGALFVPTDSLIENCLYSLQNFWKDAVGYQDAKFHVFISSDATPTPPVENSDFDIAVRLDKLYIKNTYYGQQYGFIEWEAYLYSHYSAKWSIHNRSGAILDDFTDNDLIVWSSGIQTSKSQAVENLPYVKDAWWDLGIVVAKNYAVRIFPQWKSGTRKIYMINKYPELSLQAYTAMMNDGYARSYHIWETMLLSCRKRGEKRTKSQIKYNMAIACEYQNLLEQAKDLAQQSVSLKDKYRHVNYLNLLSDREKQITLLNKQTSP